MRLNINKADGGYVVSCEKNNTDQIFVEFSDVIDFVKDYFSEDENQTRNSDDPANYKFADKEKS